MYWAEHVGVIVSDMERSVKFYSGLFDAEPIQKVEFRGKGAEPVAAMVGQPGLELDVTFFKIPHTNTIIELVKYYHLPGQPAVTYPPEAIGGLHLAFFAEDLDEAVKRLKRIGATIMTPVNLIFGAIVVVAGMMLAPVVILVTLPALISMFSRRSRTGLAAEGSLASAE